MKWRDNNTQPTFVEAVRLYRAECNLSFDEAKHRAIREFNKRGWYIPAPWGSQPAPTPGGETQK